MRKQESQNEEVDARVDCRSGGGINDWRLGDGMLNAYSAIHPLTRSETEYLKIRLIYPEKFWKIANSYYCMNKAWISVKNTEKLKTAIKQTEEKKMFLKEVFGFEL